MVRLDFQGLSLRLISAWLLALAMFWFLALAMLWPIIHFELSRGTVLASHNLWIFGPPTLFCALASVAGIGAFLERQWYRYFVYALAAAAVAVWIWKVFKAASLAVALSNLASIPILTMSLIIYNIIFGQGQPAVALVVLSVIAFRTAHPVYDSAKQSQRPEDAFPISLWKLLGGSFLLAWVPLVSKSGTTTVLSLPGIRGDEGVVLVCFILAVLSYPVVYFLSLMFSTQKLKRSHDARLALLALNLPLVNIVVGTLSWFKVLAHYLDFR